MNFIIAETFTKALGRLTSSEQSAVKQAAFDFQLNPSSPGFNFEQLDRPKDPNFRSCRVSRDIRIILHQLGDAIMLCYVDHHQPAYKWAERRKIDVHPKTGAAQIVEVVESAVVRTIVREVSQDPPPLARYESAYLEALGVPREWVEAVRCIDQRGLEELIGRLPDEAMERLIDLAAGNPVPVPATATGINPYLHPDAQRRFRVLDSQEELRQALEYPWEKWIVFLHPSQRAVVEKRFNGPAYASGSAGTGKTVVALHRALTLARRNPESSVLLTSFSRTLAGRLAKSLDLLAERDEPARRRIRVDNLHSIAVELWCRDFQGSFEAATSAHLSQAIEAARSTSGLADFSAAFLKAEWDAIVDPLGIRSWDEYRNAPRARRGTPLGARQKLRVWGTFERVWQQLDVWGVKTWNGLCLDVARALEAREFSPYQHLVIDECQDLGPAELVLARSLVRSCPDDLFLAGDAGQRIFRNRFSWQSVGIEVRGRSTRLKVNYRTTEAIRRFADRLQPAVESGSSELELRDALSLLTGPEPELAGCTSVAEEINAISEWIARMLSDGLRPTDIALFARAGGLLKSRALLAVEACGLQVNFLNEDRAGDDGITLGTMHRAKGLEFKAVGVIACDADALPLRSVMESVEDSGDRDAFVEQERNLLYVACSRARERLLISWTGASSPFIAHAVAASKL